MRYWLAVALLCCGCWSNPNHERQGDPSTPVTAAEFFEDAALYVESGQIEDTHELLKVVGKAAAGLHFNLGPAYDEAFQDYVTENKPLDIQEAAAKLRKLK